MANAQNQDSSLLAHAKFGCRRRIRLKFRHQAPLLTSAQDFAHMRLVTHVRRSSVINQSSQITRNKLIFPHYKDVFMWMYDISRGKLCLATVSFFISLQSKKYVISNGHCKAEPFVDFKRGCIPGEYIQAPPPPPTPHPPPPIFFFFLNSLQASGPST